VSRPSLSVRSYGPETGPVGLWVHGWLGDGGDGEPLAAALGLRLICPDLPGHGNTRLAQWTLAETLTALRDLASQCQWAAGYSMGGRLLMQAAAASQMQVPLVLESAFPGYRDARERQARIQADAQRALDLRTRGLTAFTHDWYAMEMWGGLSAPVRTGAIQELAAALELFSSGHQPPLWSWLSSRQEPLLWLAGMRDSAYVSHTAWVQQHCAHTIRLLDAGHAVHQMALPEWSRHVISFLSSIPNWS
jgi:2-succinyl-6-hydroxy-2,4-cyclohexadiene-1-carboxylate synthase